MHGEIVELKDDVSGSPYWNRDFAPVPAAGRKWGVRDMTALWVSMAACIPTYMLASGLIKIGMNWWQAVLTVFLGNVVVLVPMVLNAHAGTRYGIPFPVYCRAAFGILGANVPAVLRALVACGWFGIQSWIGGMAIYTLLVAVEPSYARLPPLYSGLNAAQFLCFFAFWGLNVAVIFAGIDSIRILLNIKAPLLIGLGLLLLFWFTYPQGFGPIFSQPATFGSGGDTAPDFWTAFFPALTANVGFWATLSLNIPDFSRYARSQRDQVLGQSLGLPTTMGLYAFIGVAVTSATISIHGKPIWDPVELLAKSSNIWVLGFSMFAVALATLATNIAANVVSPANDFANLWPKRIGFKLGGLITAVVGVLIHPWELLADADTYINRWLIGYSSLLGAVGGVLIADYFLIRKRNLDLAGLYLRRGPYWYTGGVNPVAMIALAAGIAPCVPGFLATIKAAEVPAFWTELYSYAWFVSFGMAFGVYLLGTKLLASSARS